MITEFNQSDYPTLSVPIPPGCVAMITSPCVGCGQPTVLVLDKARVERYLAGAHVQEVWPLMTPGERELIISGTHDGCFELMFGDRSGRN